MSRRPFPSETRAALRDNPNPRAVASDLGIHLATVYRHAEGMDLELMRELKKGGWTGAELIRILRDEYALPPSKIAGKLGFTLPYVSQALSDKQEAA